jgi:hypothetical protein
VCIRTGIQEGSFDQAESWFNGIIAAIRTREDLPNRCPIADESEDLEQEVHLLLYGNRYHKYRVYYSIQQRTPSTGNVRVFHVRHWARKSLSSTQLRKLKGGRGIIIDLRRDASQKSINELVDLIGLSWGSSVFTKLTFRFMLLKRACTRSEFEKFVSQSEFHHAEIEETLTGLEITLQK